MGHDRGRTVTDAEFWGWFIFSQLALYTLITIIGSWLMDKFTDR